MIADSKFLSILELLRNRSEELIFNLFENSENVKGIYSIWLWNNGVWELVIIDD